MTDNIFEIETTALAHVACAPQESGILLTDFAAAYPSVNHSWILSVIEKTELPEFICRFVRSIFTTASRTLNSREQLGLSFCNGIRPDLQMAPRDGYSKEPLQPGFLAACPMCLR